MPKACSKCNVGEIDYMDGKTVIFKKPDGTCSNCGNDKWLERGTPEYNANWLIQHSGYNVYD